MKSQVEIDAYIVRFLDVIGLRQMSDDLGKTEKAIKARATRLKNTGTWVNLKTREIADCVLMADYFNGFGMEHFCDIADFGTSELNDARLAMMQIADYLDAEIATRNALGRGGAA